MDLLSMCYYNLVFLLVITFSIKTVHEVLIYINITYSVHDMHISIQVHFFNHFKCVECLKYSVFT